MLDAGQSLRHNAVEAPLLANPHMMHRSNARQLETIEPTPRAQVPPPTMWPSSLTPGGLVPRAPHAPWAGPKDVDITPCGHRNDLRPRQAFRKTLWR